MMAKNLKSDSSLQNKSNLQDQKAIGHRKSLNFQDVQEHESVTTLTEQMSVNENELSDMCDDLSKIFINTTSGHNLYDD